MGSGLDKLGEEEDIKRLTKRREWVQGVVEKIENIKLDSQEFDDLQWLVENRKKIIRNKKLIDLLG